MAAVAVAPVLPGPSAVWGCRPTPPTYRPPAACAAGVR
ncbi:hypothetical protein ACFU67_03905 [Streptomyces rhizosphaericola]